MAVTSVTIEGVPVPRGNRKPVRLVRGRRLKALVGAISHLQTLRNQDEREGRKASARHYTPLLILGADNSVVSKAFKTLLIALKTAHDQKA